MEASHADLLIGAACALLGVVLGLLIGCQMGWHSAMRKARKLLNSLRQEADALRDERDLERAVEHMERPATIKKKRSSEVERELERMAKAERGTGKDEMDNIMFVNEALQVAWPFLSKFFISLLHKEVEPALKNAMPDMFKDIFFTEKCTMGKSALEIHKIVTMSEEREIRDTETITNIRFVAQVVLNSDCEIELKVPNMKLIGSTVGIRSLKLLGKAVFEIYNILDRPPFAQGGVAYFTNPPALDLTMIGDFAGVLNMSSVKQKMLDIIGKEVGKLCVLPKRYVLPIVKDQDIFILKCPPPEGVLRVSVVESRGLRLLHKENGGFLDTNVQEFLDTAQNRLASALERATGRQVGGATIAPYVNLVFGDVEWKTPPVSGELNPVWEADNIIDLTVHDSNSQQICLEVYNQESSLLWGSWQGECLGKCSVPVDRIIKDIRDMELQGEEVRITDKWWPLLHEDDMGALGEMFEMRNSSEDEVKAAFAMRSITSMSSGGQVIKFELDGKLYTAKVIQTRQAGRDGMTHLLEYLVGGEGTEWVCLNELRHMLKDNFGHSNIPYELETEEKARLCLEDLDRSAYVRLRAEWRPYTTSSNRAKDAMEGRLRKTWRLNSQSSESAAAEVTCRLLVGVYGASDLPSGLSKYQCVAVCPEANQTTCASGSARAEKKSSFKQGNEKKIIRTRDNGFQYAENTVDAKWDRPFFFHLVDPREATVTVSVVQQLQDVEMSSPSKDTLQVGLRRNSLTQSQKAKKEKRLRSLGSITYKVADLLEKDGLEELLEANLEAPVTGFITSNSQSQESIAEEDGLMRQESNNSADGDSDRCPKCKVVLRLWFLDSENDIQQI